MYNSKIIYQEILATVLVVLAVALISVIIIFSTPSGMQYYGNTLIKLVGTESHEIRFEAFPKEDFIREFGLNSSEDFITAFEGTFGDENKEENFFFVFYDIRDGTNPCISTKYGINKYSDLIYMNRRCICASVDSCRE